MNPREHIEAISKDYMANARIQDALQGAMRHVKRSFSRRGHLLMEFIQNAEDAHATRMLVKLSESGLVICNNGNSFEPPEVDSICSIGRSSKTATEYIGYLGVGFKSIFLLADRVVVHSGEYHFAFDSLEWPNNAPWQIMPVWVDEPQITEGSWKTMFKLERLNPQAIGILKDSFSSFQSRTLLWLDYLTDLVIMDGQTTMRHEKIPIEPSGSNLWRIVVTQGNEVLINEKWFIVQSDKLQVPPEVKIDQTTKDWERDEVEVRRVSAAFRLDEHHHLISEPQGTVYATIYSYTPLKDEAVPIHFLMQGDFITAPNRESIHREAEWNKWLAKKLFELLRDRCIPTFLEDKDCHSWNGTFQSVLDVADAGNHPIWDDLIRKPLAQHLNTERIIPTPDGLLVSLNDSIRIPQNMKRLIGEKELEILYPGKKPAADHVDYQKIPIAPADSLNLLLHENASKLLQSKAKSHDIDWFIKLYQGLKPYLPLTNYRKGQLRQATPFLLTESFTLSSLDSAYINPNGISIPMPVAQNFNVLHPALFMGPSSKDLEEIVSGLQIEPISEELIKKAVVQHQLPEIKERWTSLSDIERISWLELFKEYEVDSRHLKFVTLPTKSGGWQTPEKIIFSTEYHPDPDIAKLVKQGLLDASDINEPYLDPVLLGGSQDPGFVSNWVSFLKVLGVGSPLNSNRLIQLTQRVATKAAILYEKARGNQAKELPESESHLEGYDVISKSDSGTRFIEAKGRRTANEEITITHNQWKALLKNPDDYYIYVVTGALSPDPLLHPIKGTNLKSIEFSLRIQSTIWKSASEPPSPFSSFR
jgi:hypothetical protein